MFKRPIVHIFLPPFSWWTNFSLEILPNSLCMLDKITCFQYVLFIDFYFNLKFKIQPLTLWCHKTSFDFMSIVCVRSIDISDNVLFDIIRTWYSNFHHISNFLVKEHWMFLLTSRFKEFIENVFLSQLVKHLYINKFIGINKHKLNICDIIWLT